MTEERREQLFAKLLADTGIRADRKMMTSSDGTLTVVGSPRIARKDNVNDQEPHAQDRNKYNPEQTLNSNNNYKSILS